MSTPLTASDPTSILNAARCFCLPHFHELSLKTHQLAKVVVAASPPCVTPSTPVATIIAVTKTSMKVKILQPANPGSLITTYTVKLGTVSGGPYQFSQTTGAGSKIVTFSGLTSATTYFAVVIANSPAGCSSATSNEASATTSGAAPGNGLLAGTIGYWKMDEAGGNALDATGNGWTGALTNTENNFAGGIINGCRGNTAAGSGSGFTVSATIDQRAATTPWTVTLWFNNSGDAAGGGVMICMFNGPELDWVVRCDAGEKPRLLAWNSAGVNDTDITWGSDLPILTWAFVAFGFDGTKTFISVNAGTRVTATPVDSRRGGSPLVFLNYPSFVNNWPGKIDEIGYCTKARTDADLALIYNGGAGLPFSSYS